MRNILIISIFVLGGAYAWVNPDVRQEIVRVYENAVERKESQAVISQATSRRKQLNPTVTLIGNNNGQFIARGMINGSSVDFLVDTGATLVFISREEARRVGVKLSNLNYDREALTASGKTKFATVHLKEISVGGIELRNVETAISSADNISHNLLGMTFLKRIKGFEFNGNRLTLKN